MQPASPAEWGGYPDVTDKNAGAVVHKFAPPAKNNVSKMTYFVSSGA